MPGHETQLEPCNRRIEERRLLADWARVVRKLRRRVPTGKEYAAHGKYSVASFQNRFRRWSRIPDAFRTFAGRKPRWRGVLKHLVRSTPCKRR